MSKYGRLGLENWIANMAIQFYEVVMQSVLRV